MSGAAARPAALSWSLHRDPPLPAARNMALDHALAETIGPGQAALRLYGWARPTLSFGRNEPARARWRTGAVAGAVAGEPGPGDAGRTRPSVAAAPRAFAFVRRPTGGRAVLHDQELTYAVVVPARTLGGPRALYRLVNEALLSALRALGADVAMAASGAALPPDAGPCFQVPAPGEIVARGRKLVGSAQARLGGALLQHGSILLAGDQGALGDQVALGDQGALGDQAARGGQVAPDGEGALGAGGERGGAITLESLLGPVSEDEVRAAVEDGFRRVLGGAWADASYAPVLADRATRLEHERYANDAWTWRR